MQHFDTAQQSLNANPLDLIEQVLSHESWPFDRSDDDEINVSVSGQWCDYHLTFNWRGDLEALHLACAFDLKVPEAKRGEIYRLLGLINEQMWIGHFDLWSDEGLLMFRHGVLMGGGAVATAEQCESLLRLSVEACERYYPAFQYVVWAGKSAKEAVDACMFETQGHA